MILLAVLVGIILILIALSCCPDDVAGSYVSVAVEGGNVEEADEASGDAVIDPVSNAAANWARAEGGAS